MLYALIVAHTKVYKYCQLINQSLFPVKENRHNARIVVLQKLFELAFPGVDPKSDSSGYDLESLTSIDEIESFDKDFAQQLIIGVTEHYSTLDDIIQKLASEWPIAKIAKVDLQILRISILEGFLLRLTPEKVAIDEAIELAKEFSNQQSRKFVNGVLGALIDKQSDFEELTKTNSND